MNQKFFSQLKLDGFIHNFFNHAPDLFVFAKDKNFRFTMMNNALLKQVNINVESEVLGKTDHDFFSAQQADLFRTEDKELFQNEKELINRSWAIDNRKGGIDWYIASKYPLLNHRDECIGLMGIMRSTSQVGSYLSPYTQFTPVFNYIKTNISRQIEIDELAHICKLSLSQFERRFKSSLGTSPLKFINKMRIDRACELIIQTHDTLSSISLDCGFFDHSHFTKVFKRIKGMSPSQYRKDYL
jgi:AraC-like DNA-binding protein